MLRGPLVTLEEARPAGFTLEEWESYERDKIALQDARGALTMAHRLGLERGRREGKADGRREGLREAVKDLCEVYGIEVTEAQEAHLEGLDLAGLEALRQALKADKRWPSG